MIDLKGIQNTIKDIRAYGGSLMDIRDLATLYYVQERMEMEHADGYSTAGKKTELTRAAAEKWVAGMKNSDPAKPEGEKWNVEQLKPFAQKNGIPTDGEKMWEFYAVINSMYSDYYEVAKKYNVATLEFFVDLAKAFINDKDAVKGKTAKYYECIVEH